MNAIGKYSPLKVVQITDAGAYLQAGNDEVLLPKKNMPEGLKEDDKVNVFVYRDSDERLIATPQKPLAQINEAAYLKVKDNASIGSFLDWGIDKDLFVPFKEQKDTLRIDKTVLVFVYLDDETDRLVGSTKLNKFIRNENVDLNEGDEVDLLICDQTDLGYNVIINNQHWGLIYKNEVFKRIEKGERCKGYIKKIRAENKIDISLQKQGYDEVTSASNTIIDKLKENGNFLAVHDKSDPETIYRVLQMSKKTFKKATGWLFRNRQIELSDEGIRLISEKRVSVPRKK